jgi:hypothetical protein
MKNTIVYLIGHYGVGKLTVAREICAQSGARLFDNHLANNVIFSLIREDGRTAIPEAAWDLITNIRRQALTAIAEIARPEASFVLTNALMDDDPMDRAAFDEVVAVAERRNSIFVPVVLTASDAAHDARIPDPGREAGLKMTDPMGAASVRGRRRILSIDHANRLDLDTTDLPAGKAAREIIDHAERLL